MVQRLGFRVQGCDPNPEQNAAIHAYITRISAYIDSRYRFCE